MRLRYSKRYKLQAVADLKSDLPYERRPRFNQKKSNVILFYTWIFSDERSHGTRNRY